MFLKKKKMVPIEYDKTNEIPVIHASICTGEKVAGFKNIKTGAFKEVMLIVTPEDLKTFMETYDITEKIKTEY